MAFSSNTVLIIKNDLIMQQLYHLYPKSNESKSANLQSGNTLFVTSLRHAAIYIHAKIYVSSTPVFMQLLK